MVEWVASFLDNTGITSANLIGHSLGGRIGMLMAAVYPEKIKNLILINPAAYKPRKHPFFIRYARSKFVSKFVMRGILARHFVRKALRKTFFDPSIITSDEIDNYLEPLRTSDGIRALSSVARALCDEDIEKTILNYSRIHCPVLLIWGENDRILNTEILNRLREEIRDIQVSLISECGHVPQEEKPGEVCALTAEFIWSRLQA